MNELVREIEKLHTRSGKHNVTTQYKAAFYDLAEKFDLLLKERNTLSEWNKCTMNAGGDLVNQIAQLTKERDQLAAKCAAAFVKLDSVKATLAYIAHQRLPLGNTVMDTLPEHWQLAVHKALDRELGDFGQGWLSPEKAGRLVESANKIRNHCETHPAEIIDIPDSIWVPFCESLEACQ